MFYPYSFHKWETFLFQNMLYKTILIKFIFNNVIGEDGAGKTSLIGKLQGIEEYKKGRGMEYLYLNVHDEDRDGKNQF